MKATILLKAKLYQYTGVYLAQKEEAEYLKSDLFWEEFTSFRTNNPEYSYREAQDFLLGSWQGEVGLHRGHTRMSRIFQAEPNILYTTLDWVYILIRSVFYDINRILTNALKRKN